MYREIDKRYLVIEGDEGNLMLSLKQMYIMSELKRLDLSVEDRLELESVLVKIIVKLR